jgi:ParB family chromosome partitioning protein
MTADIKKRGLGRGLDALFRDVKSEEQSFQPQPAKRADEMVMAAQQLQQNAPALTGGDQVRRVGIDKLTPGKFQPRRMFRDDSLDQLAESITAHGILQPLLVRPIGADRYEIIGGERRWRAAQLAQVHEVPVVIRSMSDQEALEIGLVENLQRQDLTPLEEAEGYNRLIEEFHHTQDMVARQLGKSRSHVANTLRLLKLPASVRDLLQSGALSAGHARVLVGVANAEELAVMIVKQGLSVRQTEKLTQQAAAGKIKTLSRATHVAKDVDVLALEKKMTELLGLKVVIDGQGAAGKLVIAYTALDQLDDLLARLSITPKH